MSVNAKRNGTLVGGLLIMLCVGILYMWSIFQPYVVEHHGWAVGDVAMTSALMIACFVIGNILGGLVQMKVDPRAITLVGCLMFVGGIYLTSCIGNGNPWMLYLSYSVCSGLGCGFATAGASYLLGSLLPNFFFGTIPPSGSTTTHSRIRTGVSKPSGSSTYAILSSIFVTFPPPTALR